MKYLEVRIYNGTSMGTEYYDVLWGSPEGCVYFIGIYDDLDSAIKRAAAWQLQRLPACVVEMTNCNEKYALVVGTEGSKFVIENDNDQEDEE